MSGGNVAIAWSESSVNAITTKVQVLAPDGTPLGAATTLADVEAVEVAALAGGGFVVVWGESPSRETLTVKAQLFDAAGAAIGPPKVIEHSDRLPDTITHRSASVVEVVGLSDGGFAVSWTLSEGDYTGQARHSLVAVVADGDGAVEGRFVQPLPERDRPVAQELELVETSGGQVVVTWSDGSPDGQKIEQFVRVFGPDGVPGPAVKIGESAYGDGDGVVFVGVGGASVAGLPSGDVLVAWNVAGGLRVAVYDGAELARGAAVQRTTPELIRAEDVRSPPDIAMLPGGGFVVGWATSDGMMAARLDADGGLIGQPFRVGDVSERAPKGFELAPLGSDRFLAVWREPDANGHEALQAEVVWLGGPVQAGTAAGEAINGGFGAEALAGLEGADTLNGRGGADTLAGGPGADMFVLGADGSVDRLLDFSRAAGDRLDLRDADGAQIADGLLILDLAGGRLSWDPDSDAGPAQARAIATTELTQLTRSDFAAGVQPDGVRVLLSNGGRMETVFDWGQERFEETTSVFDAAGRTLHYFVRNDDATTGERWWDVKAAQPWATRAAEYDPDGQVKAYAVTYDDGRTEVFQFDVTNSHAWSRMVDIYDADGRQLVQAVAWDDGTAFERHHDTFDLHPWAYYIDNYRDGVLLNHTYYNADGSVFV